MMDLVELRDETFFKFVRDKLSRELNKFAPEPLTEDETIALAEQIVAKIDWDNEALMHKGLTWIAIQHWGPKSRNNRIEKP